MTSQQTNSVVFEMVNKVSRVYFKLFVFLGNVLIASQSSPHFVGRHPSGKLKCVHWLSTQQAEDHSLFPSAVSEEELDETRRKNTIKQLYGSSKIFLAPAEKCPERPELRGSVIIQSKAAEQWESWIKWKKNTFKEWKSSTLAL